VVMTVLIVRLMFMSAAIIDLNLNCTMANVEIVFKHMRHILKNLLTVSYVLIRHHNMTTTRNQA
jgi:hypothetical protein